MKDRTSEVWSDDGVIFVVVGLPMFCEMQHPVVVIHVADYRPWFPVGEQITWPERVTHPWESLYSFKRIA